MVRRAPGSPMQEQAQHTASLEARIARLESVGHVHTDEGWTEPELVALIEATGDPRWVNVAGDTMTGDLLLPTNKIAFGSTTRQMLDLYGSTYAIGVQGSTWYARSGGGFAFYQGGTHSDTAGDSGGGTRPLYISGSSMVVDAQLNASYASMTGVQPLIMRCATTGGPYIGLYDDVGVRRGYMGHVSNILRFHNDVATAVVFDNGNAERMRIDSAGILLVGQTNNGHYLTVPGVQLRGTGQVLATNDGTSIYSWWLNIGAGDAAGSYFHTFRRSTAATLIGSITQVGTSGTAYNTTSHGPFKGDVTDLDDDEALARVERWRPVSFRWKHEGGDAAGPLSEHGEPCGEVEHGFIAQEMVEVNPDAVTVGTGTQDEHDEWVEQRGAYARAVAERAEVEAERERLTQEHNEQAEAEYRASREDYEARVERAMAPVLAARSRGLIVPDPEMPEYVEPVIPELVLPELPELPEEPGEDDPFRPWGGDWSRLVPDLTAAVQALIRQNRALTERVGELEARIA